MLSITGGLSICFWNAADWLINGEHDRHSLKWENSCPENGRFDMEPDLAERGHPVSAQWRPLKTWSAPSAIAPNQRVAELAQLFYRISTGRARFQLGLAYWKALENSVPWKRTTSWWDYNYIMVDRRSPDFIKEERFRTLNELQITQTTFTARSEGKKQDRWSDSTCLKTQLNWWYAGIVVDEPRLRCTTRAQMREFDWQRS